MPMVPGLSADMPSRISCDEDPLKTLFDDDDYLPPPSSDILPSASVEAELLQCLGSEFFSTLDPLPDCGMYESSFYSPNEVKRECMFGKPDDLCSRECGQECDPFNNFVLRHCGNTSNMAIAHNFSEEYKMVNPQSVLQIQLPYSPYNDHSYHQTIGYPESDVKAYNSCESESLTDDSADEIVDVETILDKVEPPVSKVVKRRGRKPGQKLKPSNSKPAPLNKRTIAKKKGKSVQHGRVQKRQKWSKASQEFSSAASSSDAEESGKRSNHNDLERKRRNQQKKALQALRVIIPSIKNNPKSPKVTILKEAAKYVTELIAEDRKYSSIKKCHADRNAELERRLKQLHEEIGLR